MGQVSGLNDIIVGRGVLIPHFCQYPLYLVLPFSNFIQCPSPYSFLPWFLSWSIILPLITFGMGDLTRSFQLTESCDGEGTSKHPFMELYVVVCSLLLRKSNLYHPNLCLRYNLTLKFEKRKWVKKNEVRKSAAGKNLSSFYFKK